MTRCDQKSMIFTKSPASEAIAKLIELAQTGEIDPWDVKVIEIIDRFLVELGINDSENLSLEQSDLSQSGQVILWASKLVLLKAETLAQINQLTEENEESENDDREDNLELENRNYHISQLDKQIKRRTSALPSAKRKVTLGEFIAQLQAIEQEIQGKKKTINHDLPLNKSKKGYTRKQALKTITDLAHNENLTELAEQINNFLRANLISISENKIKLEQLINHWQIHKKEAKSDKVGVFWALLLLSSQSKVELHQEEFYQDINITIIP